MRFCVYGQDGPGVQEQLAARVEDHWSYLDRFADRIVLRGPTLSEDGVQHTGSVHVVDLPDRPAARRFATEEPFWLAGLYQRLTIDAAVVLHDLEAPRSDTPSTFVVGRWPARPDAARRLPTLAPDDRVGFVAALVTDDGADTIGLVATVAVPPAEAVGIVEPVAHRLAGTPVALTARRWTVGGRS